MKYLHSLLLFTVLLSACGVLEPVPTQPSVTSIPLTSYSDPVYGFGFDYPAAWMLDSIALGDRAPAGLQLTSWPHEPGMVSEVMEGGTIMNINVQLWEPKADLEAFAATRLQAWEASGFSVASSEDITLTNGQLAKEFVVQTPGGPAYFLLTTLAENYLIASGSGDIELIRLVARSIR